VGGFCQKSFLTTKYSQALVTCPVGASEPLIPRRKMEEDFPGGLQKEEWIHLRGDRLFHPILRFHDFHPHGRRLLHTGWEKDEGTITGRVCAEDTS
jgi:hypothetical protein